MKNAVRRTDIPVLLLHNLDPRWHANEIEEALKGVGIMRDALKGEGHPVVDLPVRSDDLQSLIKPYSPDEYIVLNWCEEIPGCPKSDADVAAILTDLSYTYTGAQSEVLELSWDKIAVRRILQRNGVKTPDGQIISTHQANQWNCFPAIVKPSLEHCSIGVTAGSVVMDRYELKERIGYVEELLSQPALVEDFIEGREFHVTLWGNAEIEMLPPAEMDFSAFSDIRRHVCTYDSKFSPGTEDFEKIELKIPAMLDEHRYRQLEQIACASYRAVGCRDYARIDLRMRNGTYYILDVNPNADLSTETSMVYAAASRGISYGEFVSRLVNLAAQRHKKFRASF